VPLGTIFGGSIRAGLDAGAKPAELVRSGDIPAVDLLDFRAKGRPGIRVEIAELDKLLNKRFDEVLRQKLGLDEKSEPPRDYLTKFDRYLLEAEPAWTERPTTGLDLRVLQEQLPKLLKKAERNRPQTNYKVELEVVARDTDIETGPNEGQHKE